jgi:hypothetical protein
MSPARKRWRKGIHVSPSGDRWIVRTFGRCPRAKLHIFYSLKKAMSRGYRIARRRGVSLIIHDKVKPARELRPKMFRPSRAKPKVRTPKRPPCYLRLLSSRNLTMTKKRCPVADELDPAPRILRLMAAAIVGSGEECGEDVQRFAATVARRFLRTAQILEAGSPARKIDNKRSPWEDLAYLERRASVKEWRDFAETLDPELKKKLAPKAQIPLTAQEKEQLAEFEERFGAIPVAAAQ